MTKTTTKKSKLKHFLLGPVRVLKKARQFYMKSVIECAGGYGFGAVNHIPHLPKSIIVNVDEGEDIVTKQNLSVLRCKNNAEVRKMGKIDEDQPCCFENKQISLKNNVLDLFPMKRTSVVKNVTVDHELC
ncbi:unnamed protein product [Lathyrus sativus]|nr:unnamed protein product [Lathyrus sativus]